MDKKKRVLIWIIIVIVVLLLAGFVVYSYFPQLTGNVVGEKVIKKNPGAKSPALKATNNAKRINKNPVNPALKNATKKRVKKTPVVK